jgi:hypothetical protein
MSTFKIFFYLIITLAINPKIKSIFSVPDLTKTSNKFNTYTIDFRGIDTPPATYWALANYHLDLTDFEKTHLDVTGGGAYGGLQTLPNGAKVEKVAIMSFWKINYKENGETKTLRFNRVYPPGEEMNFSGEGEGTTYRAPYNWETGNWYRFVIHTWEDYRTKETYLGQWIQDLSTKEWTLFAYFNTHLNNSYIGGGVGALAFFQEIFLSKYLKEDRSFQLKNMYIFDRSYNQWTSINTSRLYYGETPELSIDIGYSQFYFYGSCIPNIEGQNNSNKKKEFTGSISQSNSPNFSKPIFKTFNVKINKEQLDVEWEIDSKTCPCYKYSYKVEKLSELGYYSIFSYTISHPEECNFTLLSNFEGTYRITVNGTALSNEIVTKQIEKTI